MKKLFFFLIPFLIFILFSPYIFTHTALAPSFDFSKTGQIGDTFGIMNPFIAIAAALVTFLAFWVQFKANEKLAIDSKKQFISNNFFEMLRMYKDDFAKYDFAAYLDEFYSIFRIIQHMREIPENNFLKTLKISYNIFFYGYSCDLCNELEMAAFDFLTDPSKGFCYINNNPQDTIKHDFFINQINYFKVNGAAKNSCNLYRGRKKELDRYYRHLFLMVKFVVHNEILSKQEKRDFLRILRAQMSAEEQLMLFFNWISGAGIQWEETKEEFKKNKNKDTPIQYNHFFTEYKMIHNIRPEQLEFFGSDNGKDNANKFIQLIKNLCPPENLPPNIESDPTKNGNDTIFEFEDWNEDIHYFNYKGE